MKNILILYLFFITINGFATAQTPDYLIVNNDTLRLNSNPLEGYFKSKPFPPELITIRSTANWRGYIAYFKFIDNQLVVENIYKEESYKIETEEDYRHREVSIYKEIFGEEQNFKCNFYSGLLICPKGKIVNYVHMGYNSEYESYILYELKNGENIKSKEFTQEGYRNFKITYFRYFRTTDEYQIKAKEFREMLTQSEKDFGTQQYGIQQKNKRLIEKQIEFNVEKKLDGFIFMFYSDYIKTIEVPKIRYNE